MTILKLRRVVSPVLYWSDVANDRMLEAHIASRRPSGTQLQAYLQENGAYCGGVVRSEDVAFHKGPLFIPTFDLLDDREKEAVIREKRTVLAMAPADYDISGLGASICFHDCFSKYPQQVFLLNAPAPEDLATYETLLAKDDSRPNLPDESELHDEKLNVAYDMYSQKVTMGFRKVCAMLFKYMDSLTNPFSSTASVMVHEEEDGAYLVLVFSRFEDKYDRSLVTSKVPMKIVDTISSFPYRPVKFVESITTPGETRVMAGKMDSASGCTFQLKIRPGSVSVFRITLYEE